MKKKVVLALATLLVCFVAIGCSVESNENNIPKGEANNSIGLPSFSDYQDLSESEKIAIMEKTNNIPEADVVKYFEDKITNYIKDKELIAIRSLNINNDTLLMHEDKNEKKFSNLNITIDLSIDNTEKTRIELEEIATKINDELHTLCFRQDTYGYLKLNQFNVDFINSSNLPMFQYEGSNVQTFEPIPIKQPTEELKAQEIVYNSVHKNDNFSLKRFGIIDNSKELYIEIVSYINSTDNEADPVKFLNNISDALYDEITSDTNSKQYINNNKVNVVTISFGAPWHTDKFVTFNYEVKN